MINYRVATYSKLYLAVLEIWEETDDPKVASSNPGTGQYLFGSNCVAWKRRK